LAARNYRVVQNEFDKAALHEPPPEARAILQLEVGWLRWFLRLPSSCAHHIHPVARQQKARVAELAKVRAQVAYKEACVALKQAEVDFLEFGDQTAGGDIGSVARGTLERVINAGSAAVEEKIKELKEELKELKEEIEKLEVKIEKKNDALQTGEKGRFGVEKALVLRVGPAVFRNEL